MTSPPPDNAPRRFVLVDALRGLASMSVVLFHIWRQNISSETGLQLVEPLQWLIRRGNMGVPIFFVLSGFVIAHSIYGHRVTRGFFGRFILKRSLRLDPPYWASIALAIATLALSSLVLHRSGIVFPTVRDVVIHIFYLQELLGVPEIVAVYWTLCYEVQFYLVFVAIVGLTQHLSRSRSEFGILGLVVLGSIFCLSILAKREVFDCPHGLFLDRWHEFFAGVAAYWAYRQRLPNFCFFAVLLGTLVAEPLGAPVTTTVCCTALLLFWAAISGSIWTLGRGPVLQFLGRISYSLYLTHMLIGCRVARLGVERLPQISLTWAVSLMIFATLVSVGFAWVFYRLVERPSAAWSKAIGARSRAPSAPAATPSVAAMQPPERQATTLSN